MTSRVPDAEKTFTTRSTRKLLILDTRLFWRTRAKTETALPNDNIFVRGNGIHQLFNRIYTERRGMYNFLAKCFCVFDVAIWTCVHEPLAHAMVKNLFLESALSKIKFVMDRSFCTDSGVLKPDGKCNVMFKDLAMV